jgi:hypothetical protein
MQWEFEGIGAVIASWCEQNGCVYWSHVAMADYCHAYVRVGSADGPMLKAAGASKVELLRSLTVELRVHRTLSALAPRTAKVRPMLRLIRGGKR